jgi:hypothetical protein
MFKQLKLSLTVAVVVLACAVSFAKATSAPRHDNSLGVDIPYENPFMYNFVVITDGSIIEANGRYATNLRVQPYGTFELYTEQVMLCGQPTNELQHANGPVVLTYKRVAHEMVGGVACHEFEAVHHVVGDQD